MYVSKICFGYMFRTRLKILSCVWETGVPLLLCSAYGMVGMMRLVVQEHTGKLVVLYGYLDRFIMHLRKYSDTDRQTSWSNVIIYCMVIHNHTTFHINEAISLVLARALLEYRSRMTSHTT